MKYKTYVLRDSITGNFYKGMTKDIGRRLSEHKRGKTKTTKKMHNIELVYFEEFETFEEARGRELYFKTAAGRRFLKSKII